MANLYGKRLFYGTKLFQKYKKRIVQFAHYANMYFSNNYNGQRKLGLYIREIKNPQPKCM